MKIFKQFTNEAIASEYGRQKGQVVPRNIEKEVPGSYWLRFRHRGQRYKVRLVGANTRHRAEKLARQTYARIVHVDAKFAQMRGDLPFHELARRYLAENKEKAGYPKLEQRANRLINLLGDRRINTIKRQDAIEIRDQLRSELTIRKTQRSKADTNRYLELLKAMLNFAVQSEYLAANPLNRARILFREQKPEPHFFSDEEISRILDACTPPIEHIRPMIEFMLLTGCRTGEMLLLRWEDVDFEGSRVHFRNTKTAHDRFIKMGIELRDLLYHLPRFSSCPYVFPNPQSNQPYGTNSKKYDRLFPQFPRKAWKLICQRANLTDRHATPYGFRRTAATIIAKELGLHEARKVLGHANLETTSRYAAVTDQTYDRAADALEAKIKKANGGNRR